MSTAFKLAKAPVTLVCVALMGLISIIPLVIPYHVLPLTAFYSEWSAFAIGIFACFPLLLKRFWSPLSIPYSALWIFAYVLLIALQAPLVDHVYATQAVLPAMYLCWAALLIIVSAWVREQIGLERAVALLAWLLLLGAALQALTGLLQYLSIDSMRTAVVELKRGISIHGNINQRNHFATQVTLGIASLVYLYATDRVRHWLVIVGFTVLTFALAISSSRAAFAYVLFLFVMSVPLYAIAKTTTNRRLIYGIGLALALLLSWQFCLPIINNALKELLASLGISTANLDTLSAIQRSAAEGMDLRMSEWRKAWQMFLTSPLWGIGVGHYGWYSFNYQAMPEFVGVGQTDAFQHSHNLVMQILAEFGIAGVVLLSLLGFGWFRQLIPAVKSEHAYWLVLSVVMVLLLHSLVEYPLWYSYFLGLTAIFLGVGDRTALKLKFTPSLGQIAAGATLILSAAILAITFLGFRDLTRVNLIVVTSSPEDASALFQAISKNIVLRPWAEAAMAQHGKPDKNTIERQVVLTKRVMEYYPTPPRVTRQIGYLAMAHKRTEASELMKKTAVVYPESYRRFVCALRQSAEPELRNLRDEAETILGYAPSCAMDETGGKLH